MGKLVAPKSQSSDADENSDLVEDTEHNESSSSSLSEEASNINEESK